ncbi:hypothetical protein ACFLVH_02820 [Chloroflexota bacterium]
MVTPIIHLRSNIRIINEPLKGSAVFLVEAGEGRTTPETRMEWLEPLQIISCTRGYTDYDLTSGAAILGRSLAGPIQRESVDP